MYRVYLGIILIVSGGGPRCSYRAASLQFTPKFLQVHAAQLYQEKNLELLRKKILEAAEDRADIIVLPEATLFLPGYSYLYPGSPVSYAHQRVIMAFYGEEFPKNGSIPCDHPVSWVSPIRVLSCVAREAEVMVIASLVQLVKCLGNEGCPVDGQYQYNTAVVLNKEGRLIGVHHKQHVWGESPLIDQAKDDQLPLYVYMPVKQENVLCPSVVKIGILICFEIMYPTPWNATTLSATGVKDIVAPMAWAHDPPADFAGMYAQGFSVIHGINVISANDGSVPKHGNGGGIFSKGEVLEQAYNSTGHIDEVLVADVPILGGDEKRPSMKALQPRDRMDQVQQTCTIGAVVGDCVLVSSTRKGIIQLKVVSSDAEVVCFADFRAIGSNFVALVAISKVVTPPYTLDSYTLKSCVLLPSHEDGTWGFF